MKKTASLHQYASPLELRILTYLRPRMHLSNGDKRRLQNLHKGYEGEQKIYSILKDSLPPSYIFLTDLLLKENYTEFQIDLLLIGVDKIYLLEVKNYEGDYIIQNDNWYTVPTRTEIRNPLHQLKRSDMLLRRLLKQAQFPFSVEPRIIFIHPAFSLYQAPLDVPIIFPSQIDRFVKKLKSNSFHQSARQQELATFLTEQHFVNSSHSQLPEYHYEKLRKGIVCASCPRLLTVFNQENVICQACNQKETMESAVHRSVIEFITLFPNKKITTSGIQDWCHIIQSKKTIRRILKKQMRQVGRYRGAYYVKKK